jgi:signal transduction histidine kinase
VLGDAAGLLALARNLIDNAVRYGRPGGRVDVRVMRAGADPGDDPDARGAILQVDDDGPGIPPEDRDRVFDRFVRRDGASTETGSGLGLAIVRQVAARQGAEVALGDSPLGGLRVTVAWPAARRAPASGASAS